MIYKKYYLSYYDVARNAYGDTTVTIPINVKYDIIKMRNTLKNVEHPIILFNQFQGYTLNRSWNNDREIKYTNVKHNLR